MSAQQLQKLQVLLDRVQQRRDRASETRVAGPPSAPAVVASEPPLEINVPADLRPSSPPYDPMTLTDPAPRPAMPETHSQRPDRPSPAAAQSARPLPPVRPSAPTPVPQQAAPSRVSQRPSDAAEASFGDLMARTLSLRPKTH